MEGYILKVQSSHLKNVHQAENYSSPDTFNIYKLENMLVMEEVVLHTTYST